MDGLAVGDFEGLAVGFCFEWVQKIEFKRYQVIHCRSNATHGSRRGGWRGRGALPVWIQSTICEICENGSLMTYYEKNSSHLSWVFCWLISRRLINVAWLMEDRW